MGAQTLSPREHAIAAAIGRAAIPPGVGDGGGLETARRLDAWLATAPSSQFAGVRALLWAAEIAPLPTTGRRLSALPPDRATRFLEAWERSPTQLQRNLLRAILTPIKSAHFSPPFPEPVPLPPLSPHESRHLARVTDGRGITADETRACEIVVVGTGAGGAAVAYELASRGRAVLLIEEGEYHDRRTFSGHPTEMTRRLYRAHGLTMALGNVPIPIWAGRAVGGSTLVNSGTCLRAPARIFERWSRELGLTDFAGGLDPYYERAESMLGVEPASAEGIGKIGPIVARGADRLGLRHGPLPRNAPGCDGRGVCCFGCPTGAKRSTDVSYVPAALLRGAELVTSARMTGVVVRGGRARGITARTKGGATLTIEAEAVVIACGAMVTPALLSGGKTLKESQFLGRNLSIHPCSKVIAVMDEEVGMRRGIPQGYAVDALAADGIMLEGAHTPPDVTAMSIPFTGPRFSRMMAEYDRLATFGFMIEDRSRGRVWGAPGGVPLLTYHLEASDVARMQRAFVLLSELFLAAGAKRVATMIHGHEEVRTAADVAALTTARLRPGDFEVTAYHPLGTARIGTDPRTSVTDVDHETHEIRRLFVVDGSSVPTALGVNPQLTIMAMAHRAGERIDAKLG